MTVVLAHATHWLVSLLYLSPVAVIVGALGLQAVRERRRRAAGADLDSRPGED